MKVLLRYVRGVLVPTHMAGYFLYLCVLFLRYFTLIKVLNYELKSLGI